MARNFVDRHGGGGGGGEMISNIAIWEELLLEME